MLRDIFIPMMLAKLKLLPTCFFFSQPHLYINISMNDREREQEERENIIKTTIKISKILESKIAYIAIFENVPGFSIVKFMGILFATTSRDGTFTKVFQLFESPCERMLLHTLYFIAFGIGSKIGRCLQSVRNSLLSIYVIALESNFSFS